jgi:hypothetical protein
MEHSSLLRARQSILAGQVTAMKGNPAHFKITGLRSMQQATLPKNWLPKE